MQAPRAAQQRQVSTAGGPSSAADASVTTVSISYRAKLLLARASAEQSVVDQLQAQLDAFRTGGSAATLRGSDASGLSGRHGSVRDYQRRPVTTASWFTPATPRSMPARATM